MHLPILLYIFFSTFQFFNVVHFCLTFQFGPFCLIYGPNVRLLKVSGFSKKFHNFDIFRLFFQLEMEQDDVIEVYQEQTGGHRN